MRKVVEEEALLEPCAVECGPVVEQEVLSFPKKQAFEASHALPAQAHVKVALPHESEHVGQTACAGTQHNEPRVQRLVHSHGGSEFRQVEHIVHVLLHDLVHVQHDDLAVVKEPPHPHLRKGSQAEGWREVPFSGEVGQVAHVLHKFSEKYANFQAVKQPLLGRRPVTPHDQRRHTLARAAATGAERILLGRRQTQQGRLGSESAAHMRDLLLRGEGVLAHIPVLSRAV
mmetsp:Transcript_41549/g.104780  ORF Transcript_41549/g.104780 Transcript_41549/m.104780 type:complete len:229 (-) Transcript_41549:626-1312(-)